MADPDDIEDAFISRKKESRENLSRLLRGETVSPAPPVTAPPQASEQPAPDARISLMKEIPKQVLGGTRDAFVELGQSVESLGDYLRENSPLISDIDKALGGKVQVSVPEVGEPQTITGGLTRGLSQFLTAFIPISRGVKAAASTATGIKGAMASGAIADAFAFDPDSPNLSNLINQLAPEIKNPVTEYLATDPSDSEAENRFKNSLEGLGLGLITEGIFRAARTMRSAKKVKAEQPGVREAEPVEPQTKPGDDISEETKRFIKEFGEPGEIRGRIEGINYDRINTGDDVKSTISMLADRIRKERAEIRKPVTEAEVKKQAEELGLTVDELLDRDPSRLNTPEALAARDLRVGSTVRLRILSEKVLKEGHGGESEKELIKQLSRHTEIELFTTRATSTAGRNLQIFNVDVKGDLFGEQQFASNFAKTIDELPPGMTPQKFAKMIMSLESPEQLNAVAKELSKANWKDKFLEIWINGLLSGPQTHAVNILSNALFASIQIPERFLASGIGKILSGAENEIKAGEALAQMFGAVNGLKDGMRLLGKNLKAMASLKDVQISDEFSKIELRPKSITAENFNLDPGGVLGKSVDLLGEGIRTPGKALMTMDEFYKSVGYRAELQALAYRKASMEGLEGEAFSKRVVEIISDPPDHVKAESINSARYSTFTAELGEAGKDIQEALNSHPLLKIVVPFFRTPTNIVKATGERTPLAPFSKAIRNEIKAGGARRDLALARMASGSSLMALGTYMSATGNVTGFGPKEKNLRKVWLQENQPYSFVVRDKVTGEKTFYSFNRLDPIGAFFGLAADFTEIAGHLNDEDREGLALAITGAIAKNVTSKTWLTGLSKAISGVENGDFSEFIGGFSGSLIPTGVATIERTLSPGLSNVKSVDPTLGGGSTFSKELQFLQEQINRMKSRIPGLSDSLPPLRNLWGEPIYLEGGLGPDLMSPIYTKSPKNEPINNEIIKHKMSVSLPSDILMGVELKPEEYDRFLTLSGNEAKAPRTGLGLKDELTRVIKTDEYLRQSDGPDGGKALLIRSMVTAYRGLAKGILLNEFPELKEAIILKQRLKQEKMTPNNTRATP